MCTPANKLDSKNYHKISKKKQASILMALLPLSACGGGGGSSKPIAPADPAPDPTPDFTESPTNVFIALDDNNSTLSEGGATGNLTVTGKGGSDSITTGSGADKIRGGEGVDTIYAGDGNDVIVIVGTTTAGQYTNAAITNSGGSGMDLSDLITLADLNGRTVSEVVAGETIDGGTGINTLFIYGTVDLTGVTLNNVTVLVVNSDVTLTLEQISSFTTIDGDGNSVINIEIPAGSSDTYILDLSLIDTSDIGSINIDGDITVKINDADDLEGIGSISSGADDKLTLEVSGNGGDTTVNLGDIADVIEQVDVIEIDNDVTLEIDDVNDITDLGLDQISGSGEVDTGGDSNIEDVFNEIDNLNYAPTANDVAVETDEESSILIDALSNDSDPNSDDLTISSATVTSGYGSVEIIDNKIQFTPSAVYEYLGYNSENDNSYAFVEITYEISDPFGLTSTAEIDVKIKGISEIIDGTNSADILVGTDGWDVINGYEGADQITGGLERDILNGGEGDDLFLIYGTDNSSVRDTFNGGDGFDTLRLIGNDAITPTSFTGGDLKGSGIEAINLSDGFAEDFYITPYVLLNIGSDTNDDPAIGSYSMIISGHEEDSISISNLFTYTHYSLYEGQIYQNYIDNIGADSTVISVSMEIGTISGDSVPTSSFTETSPNVWEAVDDNNSVFNHVHDNEDQKIIGKGGDDLISSGSGNDIVLGGDGDDFIATNSGNDIIWGGAGLDYLSTGSSNDIIIIIGTTTSSEYSQSDITNTLGSGIDLSSVISLSDINGNTQSDVAAGEIIDGGSEIDSIFVFGVVDFRDSTLIDIEILHVLSDVTLTGSQISTLSKVTGNGSTVITIDTSTDTEQSVIDLTSTRITGIAGLDIEGDITIKINSIDDILALTDLNMISGNLTIEIDSASKFSISLIVDTVSDIDKIILSDKAILVIDDDTAISTLGITEISGAGYIDVSFSEDARDSLDSITIGSNATIKYPTATILIDDVIVDESDEIATFTVSLDNPLAYGTVTVDYIAPDGTEGSLTFLAGETEKNFTTSFSDNTDLGFDWYSSAILINPQNAIILDQSGHFHVQDDDGINAGHITEDFPPPDYDIDNMEDAYLNATDIIPGNSYVANFYEEGDRDFFKVDYTAGTAFSITISIDDEVSQSSNLFGAEFLTSNLDAYYYLDGVVRLENEYNYQLFTFMPDSDGTLYFVAEATRENSAGYYNIDTTLIDTEESPGVPDIAGDITTTAAVAIDTSFEGSLYISDVDFIEVELVAGTDYYFTAVGEDSFFTSFNFYSSDGTALFEYPWRSGVDDTISYRYFNPEESGTYYVSLENNTSDYTFSYTTIDTTEPDGSDDYTNDETTTANLTLGVAETGTFSLFGDVDWWGVNLEADTYYQIIVTNADANPTENYNFGLNDIFDSNGIELNISTRDWDVTGDYRTIISVDEGGLYYIPPSENTFSTAIDDYQISITAITTDEPDGGADYADDITTRATIDVGSSETGQLLAFDENGDITDDVDFFKVSLQAGKNYIFKVDDDTMGGGTLFTNGGHELYLYDENLNRIDSLNDEITVSGDYYISVESPYGLTGTYTVTAEEIDRSEQDGSDDLPGVYPSTITLDVNSSFDGNLYHSSDVDLLNVNLENGKVYELVISGTGATDLSETPVINLVQDRNDYASHYTWDMSFDVATGDVTIVFSYNATNTNQIMIDAYYHADSYDRSYVGDYTVTLNDITDTVLEPDNSPDYGDSPDTAEHISTNTVYQATGNFNGDHDYFTVDVTAGQSIEIKVEADTLYSASINSIQNLTSSEYVSNVRSMVEHDGTSSYTKTFIAEEGGTYGFYINASANYTLFIEEDDLTNDVPDDFTTTLSVTEGQTIQTTIEYHGDRDAVSLYMEGGHTYVVSLWEDDSTYNGTTWGEGSLARQADNSHVTNPQYYNFFETSPINDSLRYLVYQPEETGTYYITGTLGNDVEGGLLNIKFVEIDTTEPDGGLDFVNSTDTRAILSEGETLYGTLSYMYETDVVAVTLESGVSYIFNATGIDGGTFTASITSNGVNPTTDTFTETFSFTPETDGTYYFMFYNGVGDYAVTYSEMEFEPGNYPDYSDEQHTDVNMSVGMDIEGIIAGEDDIDFIGIELYQGVTYQTSITGDESPIILGVYNVEGENIAASGSSMTFQVEDDGIYNIKVRENYKDTTQYQLSVNEVPEFTAGDDQLLSRGSIVGEYYMDAGNDLMEILDSAYIDGILDGGSGTDTIRLHNDNSINESNWNLYDSLQNIEIIEFSGTADNNLTISLNQVLDFTDDANELIINGDSNDTLTSTDQGWVQGADQVIDSETYNIYAAGGATLLVDADIIQDIS